MQAVDSKLRLHCGCRLAEAGLCWKCTTAKRLAFAQASPSCRNQAAAEMHVSRRLAAVSVTWTGLPRLPACRPLPVPALPGHLLQSGPQQRLPCPAAP